MREKKSFNYVLKISRYEERMRHVKKRRKREGKGKRNRKRVSILVGSMNRDMGIKRE